MVAGQPFRSNAVGCLRCLFKGWRVGLGDSTRHSSCPLQRRAGPSPPLLGVPAGPSAPLPRSFRLRGSPAPAHFCSVQVQAGRKNGPRSTEIPAGSWPSRLTGGVRPGGAARAAAAGGGVPSRGLLSSAASGVRAPAALVSVQRSFPQVLGTRDLLSADLIAALFQPSVSASCPPGWAVGGVRWAQI